MTYYWSGIDVHKCDDVMFFSGWSSDGDDNGDDDGDDAGEILVDPSLLESLISKMDQHYL